MRSLGKVSRWMAAAMAGAIVVACAQSAADEPRTGAAGVDPRRDMVAVLPALGPHPSLGHHADLFGRFVGTWDADYSFIAEDGSVRHSRGEVLFGWILDGYALQDIFLGYPKPGSNEERRMVTGVRFVDPKTDKWTVMFAAPSFAAAVRMEGGARGIASCCAATTITGRSYAGHSTTLLPIPSSGAARRPTTAGKRGGWKKNIT